MNTHPSQKPTMHTLRDALHADVEQAKSCGVHKGDIDAHFGKARGWTGRIVDGLISFPFLDIRTWIAATGSTHAVTWIAKHILGSYYVPIHGDGDGVPARLTELYRDNAESFGSLMELYEDGQITEDELEYQVPAAIRALERTIAIEYGMIEELRAAQAKRRQGQLFDTLAEAESARNGKR